MSDKTVEQSVDTLLRYIEKDVRKIQVFKQLPLYGVFMVVLVLAQSMESRLWGESAAFYYRSQAMQVEFRYEEFGSITERGAFWGWLRETLRDMWKNAANQHGSSAYPDDPNQPLGFVLLRQYRSENNEKTCRLNTTLECVPESVKMFLRSTCTEGLAGGTVDSPLLPETQNNATYTYPFNPPPWTTNDGRKIGDPKHITPLPVQGHFSSYTDTGKSYNLHYPFGSDINEVVAELVAIENSGWFDISTRSISVEVVTYNSAVGAYLLNSFLLEISTSNAYLASSHPIRFLIFALQEDPHFPLLLTLHIFSLLYVIIDSTWSILTTYKNTLLVPGHTTVLKLANSVRFWGLLQIGATAMLLWAFVYRGLLWVEGDLITDGNFIKNHQNEWRHPSRSAELVESLTVWQALVEYAGYYSGGQTKMAMANALCWLRFFGFLQYSSRLGMLTETLSEAVSSIITVIVIFTIIMMSFSLGAVILWDTVADFRSFGETFTTLLFATATGEFKSYEAMEVRHAWYAPLYVAAFLSLSLLIILNLMISIITGAFVMVQDAMQQDISWSPALVYTDIRFFFKQQAVEWKRRCQELWFPEEDDEEDDIGPPLTGSMSRTVLLADEKNMVEERKNSTYIDLRYRAYQKLLNHAREQDESHKKLHLSVEEFIDVMEHNGGTQKTAPVRFSRGVPDKIFSKASTEICASARSIKISDDLAEKITEDMTGLASYVPRITNVEKETDLLGTIRSSQDERKVRTEDLLTGVQEVVELHQEIASGALRLANCLQEISEFVEMAEALESDHESLVLGGSKTHDLALQAKRLQQNASEMLLKIDDECALLQAAITDGSEHAVPTNMYAQQTPTLLETHPGLGIISSTEKHGYLRPLNDPGTNLEAVTLTDLPRDFVEREKSLGGKKLTSPKLTATTPPATPSEEEEEKGSEVGSEVDYDDL